jgi:hypothetical protein
MSSANTRWPRLGIKIHDSLDWQEISYTTASVIEMADAIQNNPHPIQTKTKTGAPAVWDPAIESLLRSLAKKPNALKAINHHRPKVPARVVALNRAVHFHVVRELTPKGRGQTKAAQARVSAAWGGVSEGQIKDDVAEYSVSSPTEYRSDDAKRIAEQLIAIYRQAKSASRRNALLAIDSDMKHRGATEKERKK